LIRKSNRVSGFNYYRIVLHDEFLEFCTYNIRLFIRGHNTYINRLANAKSYENGLTIIEKYLRMSYFG